MMIHALAFNEIKEKLSNYAVSAVVKEKLLNLMPYKDEKICELHMSETTEAKALLEGLGEPPLSAMTEFNRALKAVDIGELLEPAAFEMIASFIKSTKQMKRYLERGEQMGGTLASYHSGFKICEELREIIETSIRNGRVTSEASPTLKAVRRQIAMQQDVIKQQLDKLLKSKKNILAEQYILKRGSTDVLAVKKAYKNQIEGSVIDTSRTGETIFVAPACIAAFEAELESLLIEEENEVRKVLYTLAEEVAVEAPNLENNKELMETLDFAFAKAKFSKMMRGVETAVGIDLKTKIIKGRHPLLDAAQCVPLDFEMSEDVRGIIITGPNTGGKTVALKTVGLLTLMAQSGLHVPAEKGSTFQMVDEVLCDLGDGQSIEQSLSTFSAHITAVNAILKAATFQSLVLLDELGSGTDPKEGMGIAIAILEALRQKGCLVVATTHYPEVKDYVSKAEGYQNAKMCFDEISLKPLYRLQIGEAGESCALAIAKRLGFPESLIELARYYAEDSEEPHKDLKALPNIEGEILKKHQISKSTLKKKKEPLVQAVKWQIGDSVEILPEKEKGIIFSTKGERGLLGIQVKGEKKWINEKRIRLLVSANALYPEDYDFSIIFDSVANRKARKGISKGKSTIAEYDSVEASMWAKGEEKKD